MPDQILPGAVRAAEVLLGDYELTDATSSTPPPNRVMSLELARTIQRESGLSDAVAALHGCLRDHEDITKHACDCRACEHARAALARIEGQP